MKRPVFILIVIVSFSIYAFGQAIPSPSPSPSPKQPPIPQQTPSQLPEEPPPVAPNFEAPVRPLPAPERVGVDVVNQMPISLDDAIRLALENNNDIEVAQTNVRIAEFELRSANSVYDPVIVSENFYERRSTPTASIIGGAVNGTVTLSTYSGNAGITGLSRWGGGNYNFSFNSSRTNTSNQNATLNPQYPSSLNFTFTQPLLRGRGFDINRRNIEVAKKNVTLGDSEFRQRTVDVIAQVQLAYWDLVYALRNLKVQIDAVKEARNQLESNKRLASKGAIAPIEIVAANAQITTFEQNVFAAQETVTRAENTLKTLMLPSRADQVWSRALVPVSAVEISVPRIALEDAIKDALANRPEIALLTTSEEINRINERYYRDQKKPQVNLIANYTSAGLAGTTTPASIDPNTGVSRVPENLVGGYFNSLGNLFAQDYPTYRVGVSIAIPLRNKAAEANLGRTLAEGDRIRSTRSQTEQVIEADVRNALQALRSAEARLQSAAATRESAEQLYESEQRQFRAGTTTMFVVFQRQNDLIIARGRELQAQTDLNKAISQFQRSVGSTLSANSVEIVTKLGDKKASSGTREIVFKRPEFRINILSADR